MMRKIRFFKEKSNKWFLDLEGSEEKIEMTKGMEDLLVFLSGGDDTFYVQLADEKFPGATQMFLLEAAAEGAWYLVPIGSDGSNLRVFLGDFIKVLSGHFPETIWFYRSF